MSEENKPLAGALRAWLKAATASWEDNEPIDDEGCAQIIEFESGLRELVEAVEWYFSDHPCGRIKAGKKCHGCAKISAILKRVREP